MGFCWQLDAFRYTGHRRNCLIAFCRGFCLELMCIDFLMTPSGRNILFLKCNTSFTGSKGKCYFLLFCKEANLLLEYFVLVKVLFLYLIML